MRIKSHLEYFWVSSHSVFSLYFGVPDLFFSSGTSALGILHCSVCYSWIMYQTLSQSLNSFISCGFPPNGITNLHVCSDKKMAATLMQPYIQLYQDYQCVMFYHRVKVCNSVVNVVICIVTSTLGFLKQVWVLAMHMCISNMKCSHTGLFPHH